MRVFRVQNNNLARGHTTLKCIANAGDVKAEKELNIELSLSGRFDYFEG